MTTARFQLKPMEHLGAPETKQSFNRSLFSEVAPKYDFITKALSFGRDAAWKRRLLARLPEKAATVCLDLACGTGDITRMLSERYPEGRITGLDLTPAMLELARKQTANPRINYVEGSMDALPFEADSIDLVTGGYALRNAPDLGRAIDEIARVLRPGGTAAFLDFSKPGNRAGQQLSHFALKLWGGLWGLVLHGNPDVYGYIADSLKLYPDRAGLRNCFEERGFNLRASTRFFGGLLEIVRFEKSGAGADAP
ncbi:ubiquinone/menaquinone biosynthesis methyltransferase [Pontiella sp.]|uniref:ubiquinone/menaquinone biosynthesis methyltransferase n=1 Tax=Pontiella sp. TaxID=2837462 RepID=UPI0035622F9E